MCFSTNKRFMKRHMLALTFAMAGCIATFSGEVAAKELFTVNVDAGTFGSRSKTFNNIEDSFNIMNGSGLASLYSGVVGFNPNTTNFSVQGLYRGLAAQFNATGNTFTMTIPSINFTKSFTGVSRDDTVSKIKDWFKKDGGSTLDALYRKFAELTPIDPIAGNPNSLQAKTVNTAFDRGFTRLASQIDNSPPDNTNKSAESVNANLISMALKYNFSMGDYKSSTLTLPLAYVWRFNDDPRHQLSVDMPLSYTDIEGGKVYTIGFGVGYTHPINASWLLTGGIDYAATGTVELGAAGQMINSSLTSFFTYDVNSEMKFHMGNMVGYTTTIPLSVGDYKSSPGIENVVFRNGVLLYMKTPFILTGTGVELFAIDTRYVGTKLYNDGYDEFGFSFGLDRASFEAKKRKDTSLRIGISGIVAKNNNGIMLNFGYIF